jgi:hypothetical protein
MEVLHYLLKSDRARIVAIRLRVLLSRTTHFLVRSAPCGLTSVRYLVLPIWVHLDFTLWTLGKFLSSSPPFALSHVYT